MPVSKKPRKKTAAKAGSGGNGELPPLPDRRAMEGFMAGLGERREVEPIDAAQQVMYDAWDETRHGRRVALARKALTVSPLCADAYVLLAEEEAQSVEDALAYYQKGVEAGERALGPEGFEEYAGHFWGFLETRPYMRAREGLAAALWRLDRHQEALEHYGEMLDLNPNDNQGIRYVLAGHLLARNDVDALKALLKRYEDDASAAWLYTQTLLAFRDGDPNAGHLAEEAWRANGHVPGALSGANPPVVSQDGYITLGGEDEAAHYAEENGGAWRATPGSIEWLVKATAELKPRKRRADRPS